MPEKTVRNYIKSALVFSLLLFLLSTNILSAQNQEEEFAKIAAEADTVYKEKYGLRVGIDLSNLCLKPI